MAAAAAPLPTPVFVGGQRIRAAQPASVQRSRPLLLIERVHCQTRARERLVYPMDLLTQDMVSHVLSCDEGHCDHARKAVPHAGWSSAQWTLWRRGCVIDSLADHALPYRDTSDTRVFPIFKHICLYVSDAL